MKKKKLFSLRPDERIDVPLMFLFMAVLNTLVVYKYHDLMMNTHRWFRWRFFKYFELSGFDPINYAVTSAWEPGYDVYRHPLLAFLMYPFYWMNKGLSELTGYNCTLFVLTPLVVLSATASYVLLRRILTDQLRLASVDAALLAVLTWGFAYMMLASIVPDHFIFSLPLLLFTIRTAPSLPSRRGWWRGGLFFFTAGVTLTNGVKVVMADLLQGWRGLRRHWWCYLIAGMLLAGLSYWQQTRLVEPVQQVRKAEQKKADEKRLKERGLKPKKTVSRNGHPIANLPFIRWTDMTTPRDTTMVENLFGESMQFHRQHFVEDIWKRRPLFVHYDWPVNYMVELLLVVLIATGAWLQRRSRLQQLCLCWFAFDMLLHLVLGFTINEIYIMAPHWLFLFTISLAGLYRRVPSRWLRPLWIALALWLYAWNGIQLVRYLMVPVMFQ